MIRILLRALVLAGAGSFLLGACTSTTGPAPTVGAAPKPATRASDPNEPICKGAFVALDRLSERHGVSDALAAPVSGFPYLRATRLLVSYRDQVGSQAEYSAWLKRLRAVDQSARRFEIANMGTHRAAVALGYRANTPLEFLMSHLDRCGRQFVARDLRDADRLADIRAAADVADNYSVWRRGLLLYPLFRPFMASSQSEATNSLRRKLSAKDSSPIDQQFQPYPRRRGQALVSRVLASRRNDALGIPVVNDQVRDWLIDEFAPAIGFSRSARAVPARVALQGDHEAPRAVLDSASPTVYGRIAMTRYQQVTLIQLVYSIWLGTTDRGAGQAPAKALMFRVTLNERGEPIVYDMTHPRGFYYSAVPTLNARPRDGRVATEAVPGRVAMTPPGHRLRLVLDHHESMISKLDFVDGRADSRTYDIYPDDLLRSLAINDNPRRRANLYDESGVMRGSESDAPWRLLPSGIASLGAIRQWGNHAISFTERRHFDDPRVIEDQFRLR